MFGPARPAGRASGAERQIVAQVARLSRSGRADMSRARSLALLTDQVVSLRPEDGKNILAGGQYLRVPGGTILRVDLDLDVEGDQAAALFHQDVFLNGYERFSRKRVRLAAGERWRLRYEIGVVDDSSHLVVQLYATVVSEAPAMIRVHDARLSMTPGGSDEVIVIEDEITRPDPQ
jgi:hypothetical protein